MNKSGRVSSTGTCPPRSNHSGTRGTPGTRDPCTNANPRKLWLQTPIPGNFGTSSSARNS
eukprot:3539991-Rhodomonas_salina.1